MHFVLIHVFKAFRLAMEGPGAPLCYVVLYFMLLLSTVLWELKSSTPSSVSDSVVSSSVLLFVRKRRRRSSSLIMLSILPRLTPGLVCRLPCSIKRSILSRFPINFSFGNALCCPSWSIRARRSGSGSDKICQRSDGRACGQIVIVPLNCCSHS